MYRVISVLSYLADCERYEAYAEDMRQRSALTAAALSGRQQKHQSISQVHIHIYYNTVQKI